MSGLFGGGGKDPNKAAMKQQKEQMKRLDNLSLPELQEYLLQSPELVGLLDAEGIDPSAMEDITTDPRLRDMQMQALSNLQERADVGLTAQDKYQMEEMIGSVGAQEASQRKAIEQDLAERGMGDSGAGLMAKLQGSQSSANRGRQQAMQMAAQASQNRQNALSNLSSQAGQMQGQDFAQQAKVASARDAIARANAMNSQNVSAQNLAARQAIANQKAGIANQQAQVGNQIAQQDFSNQATKAGAQGSVANSMSNIAGNTPQGPSGIQQLATVGGGIVGGIYGGPMGAGAGASAGSAIGGMFNDGGVVGTKAGYGASLEDGGIASQQAAVEDHDARHREKEAKQHAAFKSKYMKRVHDEIMGQEKQEPVHAQDGAYFNQEKAQQDLNAMSAGQAPAGTAVLGRTTDVMPDQVQTYEQAQEVLNPDQGIDGAAALKGLGSVAKELGKKQPQKKLELGEFSMSAPQNTMTPINPIQFSNPYAHAQPQALADGGTVQADDGSLMFTSDGEGDIIGGDDFAGDRVDAQVNSGEVVLNAPQQQRFMDFARGKIGASELGDEDIVEGVPREYSEDLHEKLEGEMNGESGDVQSNGFKKLLEMLGSR